MFVLPIAGAMLLNSLAAADVCKPATAQLDVVQADGVTHIDLPAAFASTQSVHAKTKDGSDHDYAAVRVSALLALADVPAGKALRGKALALSVLAEARDGYRASFALAEIDPDIGGRTVWLAACRDGKALPDDEGPLRLLVPDDKRPARAVRQLERLRIVSP